MKRIANIWILVILVLFGSAQNTAAQQKKTIKLTTSNWQPYIGVSSDLMVRIFKRLGYQTRIDILPWQQALEKASAGDYHLVFNVYFSPERAKTFAFSNPYLQSDLVFCSRWEDGISYAELQDLAPHTIGVVTGVVNPKAFDPSDILTKKEAAADLDNLKRLMDSQVDLIVIDKFTAVHLVKTSPFLMMPLDHLTLHEPVLKSMAVYAMFSKARPGYHILMKAFNRELAGLINDGTFDTLMKIHNLNL